MGGGWLGSARSVSGGLGGLLVLFFKVWVINKIGWLVGGWDGWGPTRWNAFHLADLLTTVGNSGFYQRNFRNWSEEVNSGIDILL